MLGACLQLFLEVVFTGGGDHVVAHLFDHQGRGIAIEYFIDGRHGAHLHQFLDDITGLDRHALGKIGDRDGIRHFHVTHHRRGRLDELVSARNFLDLALALLKFLLTIRLVGIRLDVQFLAAVTRTAIFVFAVFAGLVVLRGGGTGGCSLLERNSRCFFSSGRSFILGALLFDCSLGGLGFLHALCDRLLLGLGTRGFFQRGFLGGSSGLGFFLLAAGLGISLFLQLPVFFLCLRLGFFLHPGLLGLDIGPAHVGALLAYLDVDCLGRGVAPGRAGHAQLALALAPQGNLLRPGLGFLAMAGAQRFEQLQLVLVRNRVVFAGDFDAGRIQLAQQLLDADPDDFRKLFSRYICHRYFPACVL